MKNFLTAIISMAFCGTFASAQQTCTATTASVNGTYGYIATQLGFSGTPMTPPGTNTQIFSDTQAGSLIGSINNGNPFWLAGTLYFDGAGNISASSSSATLAARTNVGIYTVSSSCVITVTLTDAFNTTATSTTTSASGTPIAPTVGTTSLVGLVLGGGSQIDLTAPQSTSSTNGNTPLVNAGIASPFFVQLTRGLSAACSASSLNGSYGLVGTGFVLVNNPENANTTGTGTTGTGTTGTGTTGTGTTGTGTTGTGTTGTGTTGTGTTGTGSNLAEVERPAAFLAIVNFDGNGNVIAQTVSGSSSASSALAGLQLTGTYTVNLDCSGTMKLKNNMAGSTSTTTGTGTTGTGTTGTGTTASACTTTGNTTTSTLFGSGIGAGTTTCTAPAFGTSAAATPLLVNFVLTTPSEYPINGQVIASSYSTRPGLEFSLWNAYETFFGIGVAQ